MKIPFKDESSIKFFFFLQKHRKFISSKPELQEILKEVFIEKKSDTSKNPVPNEWRMPAMENIWENMKNAFLILSFL